VSTFYRSPASPAGLIGAWIDPIGLAGSWNLSRDGSVSKEVMKTFAAIAMLLTMMAPVRAQETDVTGKWTGTLTRTAPDGRQQSIDFIFNLTQKGKELTGTAGPNAERQWTIEKGVVDGTTVTFQVQQPDGPLRTCRLTLVNDRLQGDMMLEYNGQTAEVKVNMARAE
jgi:hypothetical protein